MLDFYHRLGVLVHFGANELLSDLIIVNPQWLVDIFKRLITVPAGDELQPELADLWKQVVESGILQPKLIDHIWSDQEVSRRPQLLTIMAKFDLVCPFRTVRVTLEDRDEFDEEDEASSLLPPELGSENYMVPSLLRSEPPDAAFYDLSPDDAPALCLVSAIGFIPEAFFYRMVARCVSKYPVCPQLFRRFARLHLDDRFSLLLFHGAFWLKFVVESSFTPSSQDRDEHLTVLGGHCSSLLNFILKTASDIKRQGMAGLVFSLGMCATETSPCDGNRTERFVYITDKKCPSHSPPLPACAEIDCQGLFLKQQCVHLPPSLPAVPIPGEEKVGKSVKTPRNLQLWFASSRVLKVCGPEGTILDIHFFCVCFSENLL